MRQGSLKQMARQKTDTRHLSWQEQKPHIPDSGRQDVPSQNTNRTGSERGHLASGLGTKAQLSLSLGILLIPMQVGHVLTVLPLAPMRRVSLGYIKWPERQLGRLC